MSCRAFRQEMLIGDISEGGEYMDDYEGIRDDAIVAKYKVIL